MQLSKKALKDLRAILKKDIGEKGLKFFTKEDLHDFGSRILGLMAIVIKHKVRLAKEKQNEKK